MTVLENDWIFSQFIIDNTIWFKHVAPGHILPVGWKLNFYPPANQTCAEERAEYSEKRTERELLCCWMGFQTRATRRKSQDWREVCRFFSCPKERMIFIPSLYPYIFVPHYGKYVKESTWRGGGWFWTTRSIKCTMDTTILSFRLSHAALLSLTTVLTMIPTYHWSSSRKFLAGFIIAVRASTQSSRAYKSMDCMSKQVIDSDSMNVIIMNEAIMRVLFLGWKSQIFSLTSRKCSIWLMNNWVIPIVF